MKNISFDNPYLLLIAIPLLLAVLIPYFIAIRKENRSKSIVSSLFIHIAIALLVAIAAAGTSHETTVTKTEVVVVADVSYSTSEKIDTVDKYIASVQSSLPKNTQMAVVCFGDDYKLHTAFDEKLSSVKGVEVKNGATNISQAVEYASTLFSDDAVKRIVLITDGADTDENGIEKMISTVEKLHAEKVQIDAMYVDSNMAETTREVQVSGVSFTKSTYVNHEVKSSVMVQSSYDTKGAFLVLSQNGKEILKKPVSLTKGFNVFSIDMPTDTAGVFDYQVMIKAPDDVTAENNSNIFVQNVSEDLNVLFLSQSKADLDSAIALYGEGAKIHAYMDVSRKELKEIKTYEGITVIESVPMTIEELCKYDEIMLSNFDLREIENVSHFIELVGKVVSEFGKNLVTIGNMQIQNKTDDTLKMLEEMLPVRFGNNDQAPKLFGIVIDSSRSMYTASRLTVAKKAAEYLVNMLNEGDYVAVIQFSGESFVVQDPVEASNKEEIIKNIYDKVQPMQGTFIGGGLQKTYDEFLKGDLSSMYSEKQIMLISDGLTFTAETTDAGDIAETMYKAGIVTSTINPYCDEQAGIDLLEEVATRGGGKYYYVANENKLVDVMFSQIAADVTESIVEKELEVEINKKNDDVLEGIETIPNIHGFIQSVAKPSSTVVLTVSPEDPEIKVPLYAYRDYGSGRVSTLTTALSGEWVKEWQSETGKAFMQNILKESIPEEKIDYPYHLNITDLGGHLAVELIPLVINPQASARVILTLPEGAPIEENLIFDSEKYIGSFKATDIGKYKITIQYSYLNYGLVDEENTDALVTYEATSYFTRSYSKEYDRFELFSPAKLNSTIRHRGQITEDGTINLEPNPDFVLKYTIDFVAPATIIAVILFVIDIIVRKIKLADIKSLFSKNSKGGNKK